MADDFNTRLKAATAPIPRVRPDTAPSTSSSFDDRLKAAAPSIAPGATPTSAVGAGKPAIAGETPAPGAPADDFSARLTAATGGAPSEARGPTDPWSELTSGWTRGEGQAIQSIQVSPAVLKAQLGLGTPEELADSVAPLRARQRAAEAGLAPVDEDWRDLNYWLQTAGSVLPSALATAGSAMVGGTVGGVVGAAPGAFIGGLAGLAGSGALLANGTDFLDYLDAHGIDTTDKAKMIAGMAAHPDIVNEAKWHAAKRSGMDAVLNVAMGAGGALAERATMSTAEKLAVDTGFPIKRDLASRARAVGGEMAVGGLGMAGSEAAHEYQDTGGVKLGDVAVAGLTGVVTGLPVAHWGGRALSRVAEAAKSAIKARLPAPPSIPDAFIKDPVTGKDIPNPAAAAALGIRDMSDPENQAALHILTGIQKVTLPEDHRVGNTPADWRAKLLPAVPATTWDTQLGKQFMDLLDTVNDPKIRPEEMGAVLKQADIRLEEVHKVGMNANPSLEPDIKITNPSRLGDKTVELRIDRRSLPNSKKKLLLVESASREVDPSEAYWLMRYAQDNGMTLIGWKGNELDGTFAKKFDQTAIMGGVLHPSGQQETVKTIKIDPKDIMKPQSWGNITNPMRVRDPHKQGAVPFIPKTGIKEVDDLAAHPRVRQALMDVRINRDDDVGLAAGASEGEDNTTHISRHMPQAFTTNDGREYSPDLYLHGHEQIEKYAMEFLGKDYHDAHYDFAVPFEKAMLEHDGIDPEEYNAHLNGSYNGIKGREVEHSPPNLYRAPYEYENKTHLLKPRAKVKGDIAGRGKAPSDESQYWRRYRFRDTKRWTDKDRADTVERLGKAIQVIAEAMKISMPIKIMDEDLGKDVWGQAKHEVDHYTLRVNSLAHTSWAVMWETAAHELGHIIVYDKFRNMDPRSQLAILDAYHRWRDNVIRMQNVAHQKGVDPTNDIAFTRSAAMEYLAILGSKPALFRRAILDPDSMKHNNYWYSFHEWFAQEMAKWSTSNLRAYTALDREFRGLGKFIYRTVSRMYRYVGLQFQPDELMNHYFSHLTRDIDPGAYRDIYHKIAVESLIRNQRAMSATGIDPTLALPGSPATAPMQLAQDKLFGGKTMPEWQAQRLFKKRALNQAAKAYTQTPAQLAKLKKKGIPPLPPTHQNVIDKAKRFMGAMEAVGDKINRFYEITAGLPQITQLNSHIKELMQYTGIIQNAEVQKIKEFGVGAGIQFVRQFKRISNTKQRDELYKAWDAMDRMLYRTQDEADNGVRRMPSAAERDAITAKLEPKTKEVFEKLFELYNDHLDRWGDILKENASKKGRLSDQARRLNDIDEMLNKMKMSPYVPHMRWGRYTVRILDKNNNLQYFALAESRREQARIVKEMQKTLQTGLFKYQTGIMTEDAKPFMSIPPEMLSLVEEKLGYSMSKTQRQAIQDLQYQLSPAMAFTHRLQARDSIPGYSKDFIRGFADYFTHAANYLVRAKYRDQLQSLIMDVERQGKVLPDQEKRLSIRNYMQDHFENWVDPKPDAWKLKAGAFFWYHGYNPKSAVVNLTQIPMQTWPYLASHFGNVRAIRALLANMVYSGTYYRKATLEKGGFSDAKMKALEEGMREGKIAGALAPELAVTAEGRNMIEKTLGTPAQRAWLSFMEHSTYFFESSEHLNRKLTMMAAYDLAHDDPSARGITDAIRRNPLQFERLVARGYQVPEARAITYALDAVDASQGIYTRWARPKMFRGRLGSLFMFKSFQHQFMYMLWNHPQTAVKSLLVTTALGGLMGFPGVSDLFDWLKSIGYQAFGADWDLEREVRKFIVDTSTGEIPPDLLVHGVSARSFGIPALLEMVGDITNIHTGVGFPNTDISPSVGVGMMSPLPTAPLFGPIKNPNEAIGEAAQTAAGAAYGLGFSVYKMIEDPSWHNIRQYIFPRAIYNISRAYDALNDNLRDASGRRVIRFDPHDTSQMMEALALGLGMRPTRLTEAQQRNRAIVDAKDYWTIRREALVRQYTTAVLENDAETKKNVLVAIRRFNQTMPKEADFALISGKELIAAAKLKQKQGVMFEKGLGTGNKKQIPMGRDISRLYPTAKEVDRSPVDSSLQPP